MLTAIQQKTVKLISGNGNSFPHIDTHLAVIAYVVLIEDEIMSRIIIRIVNLKYIFLALLQVHVYNTFTVM